LHHLFDYVLVPWERVFLLGDVDLLDTERLLSRVASARVRAVPDVSMRLRYFCSPHIRRARSIPLSADISLIAEMLSLSGGDRFPPLDLSPQRKKERILAALLQQLQALARRQPV